MIKDENGLNQTNNYKYSSNHSAKKKKRKGVLLKQSIHYLLTRLLYIFWNWHFCQST